MRSGSSIAEIQASSDIGRAFARTEFSRANMRLWGQAVLYLSRLRDGGYGFVLRSKVNSPLLVGVPLAYTSAAAANAHANPRGSDRNDDNWESYAQELLTLCANESNLRSVAAGDGFEIELVDAKASVLGRSAKIANEEIAAAMIRLIAIQARRARIECTNIGSNQPMC